MVKIEKMVYQEVMDYINATKHNKPCMLQSIKKDSIKIPKNYENNIDKVTDDIIY